MERLSPSSLFYLAVRDVDVMSLKNVCRDHCGGKCCYGTEMLLLNDDVQRIVGLGFKEDFFASEFAGFKSLRNSNGRCVFHNGELCTIYPSRPVGCRRYPVIFDEDLNHPVIDKLCPFRAKFSFSFKSKRELLKLYHKLIDEREVNNNEKRLKKVIIND